MSALEEYRTAYTTTDDSQAAYVDKAKADAAIAELESRISAMRSTITHQTNIINADNALRQRVEQAEAEVERLREFIRWQTQNLKDVYDED